MNKSILFFIGGTAFGILTTMLSLSTSNLDSKAIDTELEKITFAIDDLKKTTRNLNQLVQTYTYILPQTSNTQASSPTNTSSDTTPDPSNNQTFQEETNVIIKPVSNTNQNQFNTPETETQIDQYKSIQTALSDASNNHSLILTDLINEAVNLSENQRKELTEQAMKMINNGELTVEQFMQ